MTLQPSLQVMPCALGVGGQNARRRRPVAKAVCHLQCWLRHRTEGKSNVYKPTRSRKQAGVSSINTFVQRMFDGNALLMFRHLVEEGELSDEELQELQKLIVRKRKERQK